MADDTSSGSAWDAVGAWLGAEAGKAIDANIDRQAKQPQIITNGQQAYGVDAQGHAYPLGQYGATAAVAAPMSKNMMLMVGVGAVLLVVVLVVARKG
jgi:hypothetical protein